MAARGVNSTGDHAVRMGCLVLAVPLLLVLSPLIALFLAWEEYRSRAVHRQFVLRHGAGVRGVMIYSNSPNWQTYIEREWLPKIRGRLFVMNWSHRAHWDREHPLEATIFRQLGDREFNPAAIVFRPLVPGRLFRRWLFAIRTLDPVGMLAPYEPPADVVRFFQAFRDFKHGRDQTLRSQERRLWELLEDSDSTHVVV